MIRRRRWEIISLWSFWGPISAPLRYEYSENVKCECGQTVWCALPVSQNWTDFVVSSVREQCIANYKAWKLEKAIRLSSFLLWSPRPCLPITVSLVPAIAQLWFSVAWLGISHSEFLRNRPQVMRVGFPHLPVSFGSHLLPQDFSADESTVRPKGERCTLQRSAI